MKQGTLKTLGVVALGTVAIIAGGSAASAAGPAPAPSGGAAAGQVPGQGGQIPGQGQLPGQGTAKPAAPGQAQPDQGLFSRLPVGALGNGLRLG